MIDIMGVIPLPPANSSSSVMPSLGVKVPPGRSASSFIPGCRLSHSQFDAYPVGVRFTVTRQSESMSGELDSEAAPSDRSGEVAGNSKRELAWQVAEGSGMRPAR